MLSKPSYTFFNRQMAANTGIRSVLKIIIKAVVYPDKTHLFCVQS